MGYDNSNSGALFKNDKKRTDTDRDYSGNLEATCPHCNKSSDFWVSAWINTSKAGAKYMKMLVNPKEPAQQPSGGLDRNPDGTAKPRTQEPEEFDDIPF